MGGTARSVGSGAKDLDPALRRDGLAFLLLGVAIVIALREWFGLSGIAGEVLGSADAAEGVRAYVEKREPVWKDLPPD